MSFGRDAEGPDGSTAGAEGVKESGRRRGLVGGDPGRKAQRDFGFKLTHPLFLDLTGNPDASSELGAFLAGGSDAHCRRHLEIGFGRGRFLVELATMRAADRLVGVEVRKGLCQSALSRCENAGVDNVRVVYGDVRALLGQFPKASLDAVYFMFPDPWWKKKHHKKRVLDVEMFEMLRPYLREGATILVRSDVPLVIELAREGFGAHPWLVPLVEAPYPTPMTDREVVCRRLGTPVEEVWCSYRPNGEVIG